MEDISKEHGQQQKKTKNLTTISYQRTENVKAHLDAIGIAEIRQH